MEAAAAKLLQDQGVTPEFLFNRTAPGVEEPSLAGLIAECVDEYEATILDYRAELRRIDAEVMPNARPGADQKARVTALERFNVFGLALERLTTAVGMSEGVTLSPQARHRLPANMNAEDWLRAETEARTHIRGLDDGERRETYLAACRKGDMQTVRAYELAPSVAPLVDAETIAEGAELFAAANTPAEYSLLEQQRTALAYIQGDLNRAKRELGDEAVPVSELVA